MIGGLVQKQNIRLLDESFGNRQAFFPAAGERGGGDFIILETSAAEGFSGAKREIGFGHAGFFQRGFDYRVSSFSGGKFGNLGNATQPGAFANRDVSAVWRDAPVENFEERGFAGTIGADQADAIAFRHRERNILEERRGAVSLRKSLRINNRGQIVWSSPGISLPSMSSRGKTCWLQLGCNL